MTDNLPPDPRPVSVRAFLAEWRTTTVPLRIENRGVPSGTFYPPGTDPAAMKSVNTETAAGLPAPAAERAHRVHAVLERVNRGRRSGRP